MTGRQLLGLLILAGFAALVIASFLRRKRGTKGCHGCSGTCSGCSFHCPSGRF